ncbi:MAG: type II/IV secretion system protein [Nitrospirae bacterium]|nr:MAG: type II/IV secretion system protein [Nitrospirota bacterium]
MRCNAMSNRIGEIIINLGYITRNDLDRALKIQQEEGYARRVGDILSEIVLEEGQLMKALSLQFGIPLLEDEKLPDEIPLEKISFSFLKENQILPLRIEGDKLFVAISDPLRMEILQVLEDTYGYEAVPRLVRGSVLLDHIEKLSASREAVMKRVIDDVEEEITEATDTQVDQLRDLAQEKGIIQLVNLIIENAVRDRASDIHIEPEEERLRVRYRIDGLLYEKERLPSRMTAAVTSRIKLLASMNIAERRLPQDGRIEGSFGGRELDIRVSTLPTVHGESVVMRILDREASFITLEELGFDSQLLQVYDNLIHQPYGMILITGPTGSGKSTTLYASLDRINSPDRKIITIEEPVEYLMDGINQINVRSKIGLTFATGLRHIVRQDPDIIMVGEIRDLETASISVHAALTGHLLFSTLHTNDAPGAITRLMDMGVENYLVSSTLIGVMAQRLVRRICPYCKEEYSVGEDLMREFSLKRTDLWRGRGCDECSGTGYRGRIAIFELLVMNEKLREMVMEKATSRALREEAVRSGMRTLREDGIKKVEMGITTIDEVVRVTQVEI